MHIVQCPSLALATVHAIQAFTASGLLQATSPGIVCILGGDRSGAVELTDRLLRSSISSSNAGFAGLRLVPSRMDDTN